jgi:hypothetical protein
MDVGTIPTARQFYNVCLSVGLFNDQVVLFFLSICYFNNVLICTSMLVHLTSRSA